MTLPPKYLCEISQESLRIHWCPGGLMKIADVLESWKRRGRTTCFPWIYSTSDAFFKCLGNFPGVGGNFLGNLVFLLYNKRKKTMYAQAKKTYATSLKIRGYGTKVSFLRDICLFDF